MSLLRTLLVLQPVFNCQVLFKNITDAMAAKIALVFVIAFFFIQLTSAGLLRKVRDTPTGSDAGKAIDDAVENLKTGFEDLLKNIQSNDLMKDFSESVQKLGDTIQAQGKDLVEKIQTSAKN